jgi:hypothetical protein
VGGYTRKQLANLIFRRAILEIELVLETIVTMIDRRVGEGGREGGS